MGKGRAAYGNFDTNKMQVLKGSKIIVFKSAKFSEIAERWAKGPGISLSEVRQLLDACTSSVSRILNRISGESSESFNSVNSALKSFDVSSLENYFRNS
jgi:hypothetical protein